MWVIWSTMLIACCSFVRLYLAVLKVNQSIRLLTLNYFASLMAVHWGSSGPCPVELSIYPRMEIPQLLSAPVPIFDYHYGKKIFSYICLRFAIFQCLHYPCPIPVSTLRKAWLHFLSALTLRYFASLTAVLKGKTTKIFFFFFLLMRLVVAGVKNC